MCSSKSKPRYIVGVEGMKTLYEGNYRFFAWLIWLINCRHAVAFDRRSWILNPSYWLTGFNPSENFFKTKGQS